MKNKKGTARTNKKKEPIITKKAKLLSEVIKIAASIGTVVAAFMAWCTLDQMQKEQDQAYHPDIVITPGIFEGGLDKELSKEYIYINSSEKDPAIVPRDRPMEKARFVYLEKPYLTLKNIGAGTAKDVKVTFSADWINSSLAALNDNLSDEYIFSVEEDDMVNAGYDFINYSVPSIHDSEYFLTTDEETTKSITYVAPDGESVNVAIPDNWCDILAAFFNQGFRLSGPSSPYMGDEVDIEIPDFVITIECSDIQGKKCENENITVPWTGHFTYMKTSADRDAEVESINLWTGFYEDYVR